MLEPKTSSAGIIEMQNVGIRYGQGPEILSDIKERDKNDMNRPVAPLKQADDAVLVDSTHLTLQQAADKIRDIILEKTGER